MRGRGWRRAAGIFLLALSVLLSHLPLPSAAARTTPGALVCLPATSAPSPATPAPCCEPARAAMSPPVMPTQIVSLDACCEPASCDEERSGDGADPCCPSGCHQCPRPCCSAPLALMAGRGALMPQVIGTPRLEVQLAEYTSADLRGVFHPPRG